ncbi:MAG: hypothetical protein JKX85_05715 [Phycisphaeraceae bacterium]|nr:hypothetical protein [Phycisphaeraceae bacterium]
MNAIKQAREAGVILDDQNAIAEDLPCVGCGYLLRSLQPDRDCPECGRPVGDTTRLQRLKRYPLAWLKQMQLGLQLTQITSVIFTLAMVIFTVSLQQNMRMAASATLTMVDVLLVAILFPGAVGFWLLTQPYQHNACVINWRRLARFITLTSVIGFVLCLIIPAITETLGLFETMGILTAWFAIGAWAILQHASAIAQMIPHRQMTSWSRRLSVFTLIYLIGCAVYGGCLSMGLNSMVGPFTRNILYHTVPMIGVGILITLCVVYVFLLKWYQRRFAEAIKQTDEDRKN